MTEAILNSGGLRSSFQVPEFPETEPEPKYGTHPDAQESTWNVTPVIGDSPQFVPLKMRIIYLIGCDPKYFDHKDG